MRPERFQRLEQLFGAVVERPEIEREAILAGEDADLIADVESLLAADVQAGRFLEDAVASGAAAVLQEGTQDETQDEIGLRLGPYRLVRELGRGGMGVVYLAERDDEEFRQRAAIKLLHRGLETGEIVARFQTERQILAHLDHPSIARLFDGGTSADGRPYFVMELIEGKPIDVHAEGLSLRGRLELMIEVLAAVREAHRNLVVHRDLKPSNVLVTADGRPKLLDFGVAKILAPEGLAEVTSHGLALPMTLAWASPEQVLGLPVTTATDVYALGVLLYRLLTGRHPYPIEGRSVREIERLILEHRPERPSAVAQVPRQLRGDLDTIVLGALAKEPAERYGSAERLAEDLGLVLQGRPITFRPTPLRTRALKFVRRHRWGTAAAALIAALALSLAGSLALGSARTARERDRATQVASLLVDLFEIADPGERRGSSITARELLDQGTERVLQRLDGQPETQGAMLTTLGRLYVQLGLYDRAVEVLRESVAVERVRGEGAEDHPDLVLALRGLGRALALGGRFAEAEPVFREVLERARRLYPADHAEVAISLNNHALVQHDLGHYAAAGPLYRDAVELERRNGSGSTVARANWALLLIDLGRYEEASALCREVLAIREKESNPAGAASILEYLAMALQGARRLGEAEAVARRSLDLRERHLSPDDRDIARSRNVLGAVLRDRGDLDGAEALLRRALAERRRLLGSGHAEVAVSLEDLGDLLAARGRQAEAGQMFGEAIRILSSSFSASHPTIDRLEGKRAGLQ
jgi:serine/threonine protein kinase/Flp pilus assembly protein TadD